MQYSHLPSPFSFLNNPFTTIIPMRKTLLILLSVFFFQHVCAQDQYSITSFDEMVGQNIAIYDIDLIDQEYGHVFSLKDESQKPKGKTKTKSKVQKLDEEKPGLYGIFKCTDIVTEKKHRYAVLVSGNRVMQMLLEDETMLRHMLGTRQMEQLLEIARRKYQYKVNADFAEGYLSEDATVWMQKKYVPVEWTGYTIPNKRSGDVVYNYSVGSKKYTVTSLSDVEGQFITEDQYQKKLEEYKSKMEEYRLQAEKDSTYDDNTFIAYCVRRKVFYEEVEEGSELIGDTIVELKVGDEIFPYAYDAETRTVRFYFHGNDLSIDPLYLNFDNSADLLYLKRRGKQGLDTRRDNAFHSDRQLFLDYLEEQKRK